MVMEITNDSQRLNNSPMDTIPDVSEPQSRGFFPNTPLTSAIISFLLGSTFSLGLFAFISGCVTDWWPAYQAGFFVSAWSFFHWAEFAVTAGWNKEKCSVNSYLLDNGLTYHLATGFAVIEYLITLYFRPSAKTYPCISQIGIVSVITGQFLRSAAMIHASTNFSHFVAFKKLDNHRLVTDGVYAWSRHPSYAGFFYWALGTQLALQNPVSFIAYFFLLWRFFYNRTKAEEAALVKFFGRDYIQYRKSVGTWIPFVHGINLAATA